MTIAHLSREVVWYPRRQCFRLRQYYHFQLRRSLPVMAMQLGQQIAVDFDVPARM